MNQSKEESNGVSSRKGFEFLDVDFDLIHEQLLARYMSLRSGDYKWFLEKKIKTYVKKGLTRNEAIYAISVEDKRVSSIMIQANPREVYNKLCSVTTGNQFF